MRRGFTLIEMMIVVALIATLMTIVFRLSSVSSNEVRRNTTVTRLARLENCLSGYYAAFGNYPPVPLHNTRDIYLKADGSGVQSTDEVNENIWGWTKINERNEQDAWNQVEAACRAQPVGAEFPFSTRDDDLQEVLLDAKETIQANLSSGKFKNYPKPGTTKYTLFMQDFDALQSNLGRFDDATSAYSWRQIQVFKFGLMSFLLPRYQMMMAGDENIYTYFAQWTKNNGAVSNPMTGAKYTWQELHDLNEQIAQATSPSQSRMQRAKLENIPSDAVCVRWLPNLSGICAGSRSEITYYGVNVADRDSSSASSLDPSDDPDSSFPPLHIYVPGGAAHGSRQPYILDSMTVLDGWNNEFYYYSPSPHQSYQLWSAGANGRTFPPWVSRKTLPADANRCVGYWISDDIVGLKN